MSLFIASNASTICMRRFFRLRRYNSKNDFYFSFSSVASNNDDGDGRETGRNGNDASTTSGNKKFNLQQPPIPRPSVKSIPRTLHECDQSLNSTYRNRNLASSSLEDHTKLRELESFITGDHHIHKSSSPTPLPPQSKSNNKRLSSTPPLHWSIPKQYIKTNPNNTNNNSNRFPYNNNNKKQESESNSRVSPRERNIIKDRMNACRSIAQLIDIVYLENSRSGDDSNKHYKNDIISDVDCIDAVVQHPPILVTFWEKLASLLKENSHRAIVGGKSSPITTCSTDQQRPQEAELLSHRLETIVNHTITALPEYHPGQLRNIAFAKATIVKDIGNKRGIGVHRNVNKQANVDQNIMLLLYNQLVKSNNATRFWNTMQQQVLLLSMDNFRPKWLVSIAWSLATITDIMRNHRHNNHHRNHRNNRSDGNGSNNHTVNVIPFFHALKSTFNKRRTEFSSKHLGNLAWSTMTCRVVDNTSSVLHDFANEFISRRENSRLDEEGRGNEKGGGPHDDEDGIDPMTLCQWASSYAKAGHKNEELFRAIASTAIPMLKEKEFDNRYLANLAYSFALAELPSSISSSASASSSSSLKMMNVGGDGESSASSPSYLSYLFDTIAIASMEKLPSFTTQNFANIVWAYAKVGHSSPTLFDGVAREAMPRLMEFSSQELANLAWAFSKFQHDQLFETLSLPPPLFDRIAEEVSTRGLQSFTLQGVSMLANSFATVGHTANTVVWEAIDNAILTRRRELGHLECSHIARSFAMIGRRSDDVFREIELVVLPNIHQLKPPGLSSLAWAYATCGYHVPDLYLAIAEQSLHCLDEFNRVDEVMLVLALSRIDLPLQNLRDEIFARSKSHLNEYTELDLFNMLISYVRAGYKSEHWMEAMANEIISRAPSSFDPKMIVGIAHSFASAGYRHPALLYYLLGIICVDNMEKLEPKELASLAWSLATVEFFDRKFFSTLADSCGGRWHEFEAASLATMAWAYATAREDRPELFHGIMNASLDRVRDFSPQGVSMLLWACSTAGHSDQNLFHSFEETAEMLLNECDSQSLANIAWAYAVADFDPGTLFGPTSKFIDIVSEKFDAFNGQGLCQLHQWNIWRKSLGIYSSLPPHIEKRCYDEFRSQTIRRSTLQNDVMFELNSMGIYFEEESLTPSGFSVDALIDLNGKQMAVEVDGPRHFVGTKLTGNSILKHRQVASVDGISVVSLRYWELACLETSEDKQQYLRAKLGLAKE